MRTWAFVSQKGGSGKSTLCTQLATYAEQQGEIVCIVDLDPQTNAVLWSQIRGTKEPMVLAAAAEKLGEIIAAANTLGVTLVMIDSPSKVDAAALASIRAADLIIAPTRASLFDLAALSDTVRLLRTAGKLEAAVGVINCVPSDKGKEAATVAHASLALERIGLAIAPAHICERPPFATAIEVGKGVTEKVPKSPAADEIRKLWAALATPAAKPAKATAKGKARASS
jgi:chromosome partitioning protein